MRIARFEGYREGDEVAAVFRARRRRLGSYDGVVTPGQMLDHANAVEFEFSKLDADVRSSSAPDNFKTQWAAFLQTWRNFFDSLQGPSGYVKRLWAGTDDEIDNYRSRVVAWQDSFQRAGGSITGASAAKPPKSFGLGAVKPILIAAAVLYGLVTFGPVISRMLGGKR